MGQKVGGNFYIHLQGRSVMVCVPIERCLYPEILLALLLDGFATNRFSEVSSSLFQEKCLYMVRPLKAYVVVPDVTIFGL
jgi:hypothetical protein